MRPPVLRFQALLLALVAAAGCDSGAPFDPNRGNPVDAAYVMDTAGLSPAAPGEAVRVAVRLTGADAAPVAGWPVVWTSRSRSPLANAPQGALSSDTTRTGPDGVAEVTWTLGGAPETYVLSARAANVAQRRPGGGVGPVAPPDLVVVAQ